MTFEDGFLKSGKEFVSCSFRENASCGSHCLHFKLRDSKYLSDEVPTGKRFLFWELTKLDWVVDGKEAVLRCGAENVYIELENEK